MGEIKTKRYNPELEEDADLTMETATTEKSNDAASKQNEEDERYPCYDCDGWDETGGDCYRTSCSRNSHKYGEVPYASDLYPTGEW